MTLFSDSLAASADTRRLPGGCSGRRARHPDGPRGVVPHQRSDTAGGGAARTVRARHAAGGQGSVRRVSGRRPAFRVSGLRQVPSIHLSIRLAFGGIGSAHCIEESRRDEPRKSIRLVREVRHERSRDKQRVSNA